MKKGLDRWFSHYTWLVCGVLLVLAGIFTLILAPDTLTNMAAAIGVVMIVAGLMQLGVRFLVRTTVFGAHAFISDALLTILVGVFLLCNSFFASEVLRFLVGMWILSTGVIRVTIALELRKGQVKGWFWMLLIALLSIALGILTFAKPVVANLMAGVTVAIVLIYQGLTFIYMWNMVRQWYKALEQR